MVLSLTVSNPIQATCGGRIAAPRKTSRTGRVKETEKEHSDMRSERVSAKRDRRIDRPGSKQRRAMRDKLKGGREPRKGRKEVRKVPEGKGEWGTDRKEPSGESTEEAEEPERECPWGS
jgi:hypothetical protein